MELYIAQVISKSETASMAVFLVVHYSELDALETLRALLGNFAYAELHAVPGGKARS
jgi:hypothetical protein